MSRHSPKPLLKQEDVIEITQNGLCLLGIGAHTTAAAAFRTMDLMEKQANGEKKLNDHLQHPPAPFTRVALVRDLFDRDEVLRPHLSSVLKVVLRRGSPGAIEAFVLVQSVAGPDCLRRRLVNEYELFRPAPDARRPARYRLVRSGVELSEYLLGLGPVLLAQDESELASRQSWDANEVPHQPSCQAGAGKGWNMERRREERTQRTTDTVLMVAPIGFQSNEETAQDNHFMHSLTSEEDTGIERKALAEFSHLHRALTSAGVNVVLHAAERHHHTPDAVFPNNWFSTHSAAETGFPMLVLYPMKSSSRRAERRQPIIEEMQRIYEREMGLQHWENSDPPRFLEGTGVLILDRVRKVAYAALSQRCSRRVALRWAELMGYEVCFFRAHDARGQPIYHTNVMMSVGTSMAVVCLESVDSIEEREALRKMLGISHEIVEITRAQVDEFCGNVLEVKSSRGKRLLCMSSRAFSAFNQSQKAALLKHTDELLHVPVPTIETVGGGGVRCMMAELFW